MPAERRFPIKQLYDENGKPYYPITHIDLVNGDRKKLDLIGTIIRIADLSPYLITPFTGEFTVNMLNNMIYIYSGSISYTENGSPIEHEKDITIAKNIPELYRSKFQIITCSSVSGANDRINVWLDNKGNLLCRVTPKMVLKDRDYESDYQSSIKRIDFNGLFFRSRMEDDLN